MNVLNDKIYSDDWIFHPNFHHHNSRLSLISASRIFSTPKEKSVSFHRHDDGTNHLQSLEGVFFKGQRSGSSQSISPAEVQRFGSGQSISSAEVSQRLDSGKKSTTASEEAKGNPWECVCVCVRAGEGRGGGKVADAGNRASMINKTTPPN